MVMANKEWSTPRTISLTIPSTLKGRGGLEGLRSVASRVPDPGEPRGPAARGWCKTPLAGRAPGARGAPGALPDPGTGIPDPGSGDLPGPGSRRGLPALPRGSPGSRFRAPGPRPPRRSPARGGFYINPSRRGPAVPGGGTPGPGSPGGSPGPPREAKSRPGREDRKSPLFRTPGNRGAPARGVDVKPSPGAGIFRPFSGNWPFLANFRDFSPVATGLLFRKMAKNSHFWPKCRKIGFLGV